MNRVDLEHDPGAAELLERLRRGEPQVCVDGSWGSFPALMTGWLSESLSRTVVMVCPHGQDAEHLADDLPTFGVRRPELLPAWEGEEEWVDATDEIRAERQRLTLRWAERPPTAVLVTSITALLQPVASPERLREGALSLAVGQTIEPERIAGWLVDAGFESVDRVDIPGQFARRGGILDVFAPVCLLGGDSDRAGEEGPERATESEQSCALRVEFFGDTIESLRRIDLDTHRSTRAYEQACLISAAENAGPGPGGCFLEVLPADCLLVLLEPADCQEVARVFRERCRRPERLIAWEDVLRHGRRFQRVELSRFVSDGQAGCHVDVRSVQQLQHAARMAWSDHRAALSSVLEEVAGGKRVVLLCDSAAEEARLQEILAQMAPASPEGLVFQRGTLHQGFEVAALRTLWVSHHELFGQSTLRRVQRPLRPTVAVDSLNDLAAGDTVVHVSHGIGKFLGVDCIEDDGQRCEYLILEYADQTRVRVPVSHINLVQKFIGTSPKRPRLSKVGSRQWQRQKQKVARAVQDMASELLELQARRQSSGGIAFGPDSHYQREFEACFPYTETPDQLRAIAEIKADMERPVAMDRLLCGDVGYGKTEIAMRAAFKAVENGKQVAVLVPTTVLCEQHGRTFRERFADFPVGIEVLNRFCTPREGRQILERCRQGRVDIVIGTHRLLSDDVVFKDLGLVVIDEEQRFGVEHKERLKRMRVNVDILTLSATPIPRTLHMSLLGLRDISSLSTPPLDRRAVVTRVCGARPDLIRQGILQELQRGGQVYFLHNRVKTIEKRARELADWVGDPAVRFRVAHGQMSKRELEAAMIEFVRGDVDVLVCTTIIESGLDIPNANTIFIDNADQFGLAELHQLRGRVGRYHRRAYATMLLPTRRSVSPIGVKRLKAIEEYSHLGAGFKIALRDLEIRGAGNLLGAEQSGHIQLVGYQMYCELLAQAVRKLKDPSAAEPAGHVSLNLGISAVIPREYIASDRLRMDVYRRLATCRNREQLRELGEELADVYGPRPSEVERLLDLTAVRLRAAEYGVTEIARRGKQLVFVFTDDLQDSQRRLFARIKGTLRCPDRRTVHLELSPAAFEPETLLTLLRKLFGLVAAPTGRRGKTPRQSITG